MDSNFIHRVNQSLELYQVDPRFMSPAIPIDFQGFTPFILTGNPLEGCKNFFDNMQAQ